MQNPGDDPPADLPRLEKLDSPAGSPPAASELESCVSNLSLAHEIVVNGDFVFAPRAPPPDSLEGTVTRVLHRAFWDGLREQLDSDPPNYDRAVVLLQDVKTTLQSLLLPAHVRLRHQLDEVLDPALIRQEADHGALDLGRLAGYVVDTMASLCAPVRDPEVRALRNLEDPVELLREILRVLGLMKTDMVNFTIRTLRPHLLQQAVQYERAKFQQILDRQPASLDNTAAWLQAAASEEASAVGARPDSPGPVGADAVLDRAYVNLLDWDLQEGGYPEVALMDRARLDDLGQRVRLLVLEASVLLLIGAQAGGAVPSRCVGKVRRAVAALLEGSLSRDGDLKGALPGLGETVLRLLSEGGAAPPGGNQDLLRGQISDLWRRDDPVRALVGQRVQDFLRATLRAGPAKSGPEPPAPLGPVGAELAQLGATFGRIVRFNRAVFGPFCAPVLGRLPLPSGEGGAEAGEDSR